MAIIKHREIKPKRRKCIEWYRIKKLRENKKRESWIQFMFIWIY